MKIGGTIKSMLHDSGEDIIVSYRTGNTALIQNGKIKKIYTHENYQEVSWQRDDWKKAEQLEAAEQEQEQLKAVSEALQANEYKKKRAAAN